MVPFQKLLSHVPGMNLRVGTEGVYVITGAVITITTVEIIRTNNIVVGNSFALKDDITLTGEQLNKLRTNSYLQ